MHDVIERIACFIVCREFWHYEPPKQLIVNNMRVEQHGEHVIHLPTNGARWNLIRWDSCLLLFWWLTGHSDIIVAAEGLRQASRVSVMPGFPSMLGT